MDLSHQIGMQFESREEVRRAGLHKHSMAGIGYDSDGNAESIVISGGYKDDLDEGDVIIYTGQGGQSRDGGSTQVKDQVLERGNRALVNAALNQIPIRVIRGARGDKRFSPQTGYRYDGLFMVSKHWFEKSKDGPLVVRFELRKIDESFYEVALENFSETTIGETPVGSINPVRKLSNPIDRIKRDPTVVKWVKALYGNQCQICQTTLRTPTTSYSQGAHIRGLGTPHNGADTTSNMLCLCANCHILFDFGAIYIDSDTFEVHNVVEKSKSTLILNDNHKLDIEAINYHKLHYAGIQ